MRRILLLLLTMVSLQTGFSCQTICGPEDPEPACQTPATIKDLTGLDGCGFVLVLDNGQRLEPHGALWEAYAKHDGERVTISYSRSAMGSICMVGETVELNCIQQQQGFCGTPAPSQGNN